MTEAKTNTVAEAGSISRSFCLPSGSFVNNIRTLYLDEYLSDRAVGGGIDLLVFAHGAFIRTGDEKLIEVGLGRAHYRLLRLVARRPNIGVHDALKALQITKQSLNRVNSELIDRNLIEQTFCNQDRRRRLLRITNEGEALLTDVSAIFSSHVKRAYSMVGPEAVQGFWLLMQHLVPAEARDGLGLLDTESS